MVLLNVLFMIFLGYKLYLVIFVKDLDIILMYVIIWNIYCCVILNNGWGRLFNGNNIIFFDDIECICYYF